MSKKPTAQIDKLIKRLNTGKNLTRTEARRLGIASLRQRVFDLRNNGFDIRTNRVKEKGRTVSAYRLVGA